MHWKKNENIMENGIENGLIEYQKERDPTENGIRGSLSVNLEGESISFSRALVGGQWWSFKAEAFVAMALDLGFGFFPLFCGYRSKL